MVEEILNYIKDVYDDAKVRHQIDESIRILNGEAGEKSKKVVDMLRVIRNEYDDDEVKSQISLAIEKLS